MESREIEGGQNGPESEAVEADPISPLLINSSPPFHKTSLEDKNFKSIRM